MTLAIETFPDRAVLMRTAADRMAQALSAAIAQHGQACIALSGGTTPGPAYEHLAAIDLNWQVVTLALVDERMIAPADNASNEFLVRRTLGPAINRGATFAPMFSASNAAAEAEGVYAALKIDLALMGMGADGHTASWIPGADGLLAALDPANPHAIAPIRAPGAAGAAERLTLTRRALRGVPKIILLITGVEKRAKLEAAATQSVEQAPVAALFADGRPEVLWAP
jgi:6-phosphogluconolactonase